MKILVLIFTLFAVINVFSGVEGNCCSDLSKASKNATASCAKEEAGHHDSKDVGGHCKLHCVHNLISFVSFNEFKVFPLESTAVGEYSFPHYSTEQAAPFRPPLA